MFFTSISTPGYVISVKLITDTISILSISTVSTYAMDKSCTFTNMTSARNKKTINDVDGRSGYYLFLYPRFC